MKAFQISGFGAEPALVDTEIRAPQAGEIRVRILACGLNFADLLMIRGEYQERPEPPVTLGMELSGVVDAVGPDVAGLVAGDRVMVFAGSGGLAEYGCFAAGRCMKIPDTMPFHIAAGFQVAYGTSHVALAHRAQLQPGETLLVLGAAGGVGLTAVEIGRQMGAHVIAVARGAEKVAVARAAGANEALDSDRIGDLRTELRERGGIDVVYDPIGGDQGAAALRSLRPEGRHLVIGFASGTVPQVAANHLLVKNLSMIGFYWGGYAAFRPAVLRSSLDTLLDWYQAGRLHPHVSHRLPLSEAARGLGLLRTRQATGKVVIDCQSL